MNRLLNTKEAAEFLGLSAHSLEKYRARGTGPKFIKAPGTGRRGIASGEVRYREHDLMEWAVAEYEKATGRLSRVVRDAAGIQTSGGCDDCDAVKFITEVAPRVYVCVVAHDDTCPSPDNPKRVS